VKRAAWAAAALAAVVAAGAGGVLLVRPDLLQRHSIKAEPPAVSGGTRALYYRDPDGKPAYSLAPAKTPDGRAYIAVQPGEEKLSFETGEEPAAPAGGKIKFYRNPMGLADYSPVPKKDSMGMDYIPVYEDEATDDGSVKLTPGKIQRTGVKSEPARKQIIRSVIRAPGTIQLDERRVSVVSMRSESWIQKVADVTTGSRVRKGDLLMEVYSPAVSAAAAEYVAIRNTPEDRKGILSAGVRQRLQNLDIPEAAMASIEKERTAPIAIAWTAPRDGVVLERNAVEGMRVQPGDTVFRLADTSVVWTLIDVAERDMSRIKAGRMASVKARGYPGRIFQGQVTVVYPQVNKESRTVRVRIELPNADLALLPDMYVDAEIDAGSAEPVMAVPDSAVLDSGQRQVVFIDRGEGRLEPRDVKLGFRGDGLAEIRDGVAEGDLVVTSANFLIDAESNLNAAMKGFAAGGAQP
jgi:membrane fusion protein, copper/silver efflux system